MAKVIKLKDRQGNVVLPLTRSQLVQVSKITGLDLLNGKTFESASVQNALEALMAYATTIKQSSDTATTDITTIKSALEGVLDTQRAVVNKIKQDRRRFRRQDVIFQNVIMKNFSDKSKRIQKRKVK